MLEPMRKLRVDVWSDIACPWCYVGKRRLEAAIARMPSPGDVEVVWRSFELDHKAPRVQRAKTSYAERLARKYRASLEQANAMIARMTAVGAADGITLRFDRVRPANTFDAHRVLHLARDRGVQGAVKERLMRAYFTEGEALGNRKTLARLSGEAGLDPDEVRRVLAGDSYADAVRADEDEAGRLGIHAVPFFGIGEEYGVTGAQPVDILHGALMQAGAETPERAVPQGAACGPGGCA
jgi:predicted DsbA family dithiol-disulfide isomerase